MFRFFTFLSLFFFASTLLAQTPQDIVVPVQLSVGLNPPAVYLNWTNPAPSDIILRRRVKGSSGNSWVEVVSANSTLLNGHFDSGLDATETYEYAVERKTGNVTAYGYAFANFFKPVVDDRGKILVFIDSSTADQLGADLITFKNDLRGEGWHTIPHKTGPFTSVQWVKNQIMTAYNADPGNVKAVLLMGNVPIPYSGSMAWDTKSDHVGAWPSDAFYGDVDGTWTDNSVNIPNTARLANRNVPGDGKFDQSTLPSSVELPVGRLDFRRLSAATFGATPVEILRKYLWKNHLWRTGQYKVPNLALVDDHLGWSGGEAFAADGYRNAIPLVGEGNVIAGAFINPQRHLLSYGAGANGTYSSADGIGTSDNFATDSVRTVFANLYGDYFGDWDFETNPLMPALLASKGIVLAVSWAGRPHWMQHGLASGETIGFCLKETQNAQYNTAYGDSNGESGANISLLGDPTLRAKIVPPVGNLTVVSNCDRVNLHWTASPDPEVLAYLIYRSFSLDGPYIRVTPDLLFQTSWADLAPVADTLFYSVRAVKLEVTPGGGAFYNSSTGAPKPVVFVPGTGPTAIALGGVLNCNAPTLTLGSNYSPSNSTLQWYQPDGQLLNGFTATEGGVYTVVVTAPNGCTTAAYATVYLDTMLPEINLPGNIFLNCIAPSFAYTVPDAPSGVHYFFNGAEVFPGQNIQITASSTFTVSSTINGCSETKNITVFVDATPPNAQIGHNGLVLDCTHPSVQLVGPPINATSYAWSVDGGPSFSLQQSVEVNFPGTYCLTVSGVNGCTSSSCVIVTTQGGMNLFVSFSFEGDPCNPADRTLVANASGGLEPYEYLWSIGGTTQSVLLPDGFTGIVTVTVTDAFDCMSISALYVAPGLEVLALLDEESFPGAADGYIDLLVLGGQAPFTFIWSNGSTTEDISGLSNGAYSVTVTGSNGCSTVLTALLMAVGVEDLASELDLKILPNPAWDELRVFVGNNTADGIQLWLTDLSGRNISAQSGHQAAFIFDISHLPGGVYVLWVERNESRQAFRVVVGS
ncbi:MAG: T9SS type A sorting domain-containing protein [Saprospiraceae bacterium]|nr:T9SS type A sorting domain-containing protein [Saprospiraceae bacterium]